MNAMPRCGEAWSEISNPTRLTSLAIPSPSIAERAKCFGTTLSTPRSNLSSSGKNNAFKDSATSARALTPRSTGRSVVTGRESLTAYKSGSNLKQSAMKESSPFHKGSEEPLCPANIVASRRTLFSPGSNSKRPPQAVKTSSQKIAAPLLLPFRSSPTSDKENSGQGKRSKRFSDISSVQLKEVTKSYSFSDLSFSDLSPKERSEPVHDTTGFDPATTAQVVDSEARYQRSNRKLLETRSLPDTKEKKEIVQSKPSLFEQRAQWLQQRVTKANSFTEPEEAENETLKPNVMERRAHWLQQKVVKVNRINKSEQVEEKIDATTTTCKETSNNMVAARLPWLQKQVSLHRMPGCETSTEKRRNTVDVRVKKECQLDTPTVATLNKTISPPRSVTSSVDQTACALEGKKTNKLLKKAKKTLELKKTLVEERAHWLQKQVCRNELHQDIPSDIEEQQDTGQACDGEQPKCDIELRLEALKREMAASHHRSAGVAPKRALAELP